MIASLPATLPPIVSLPVMFFRLHMNSSISFYSNIADKAYDLVELMVTLSSNNIAQSFTVLYRYNVIALLVLQSESIGDIYEIQDYSYSPDVASILTSSTIHIDASKLVT